MTEAVLSCRGLTRTYTNGGGVVNAVTEIDLDMRKSEFIAIVGPSGSGKTTLLSMLGGLEKPSSGEMFVDGEPVNTKFRDLSDYRREQVGFVFQSYNLVPFLTARENLTIMSSIARLDRATIERRADLLLDELGLAERRGNLPEQLSGGERQRVAIGRALITDPALILVDEPTASLDTQLGTQVVELLADEIKKRDKSGIMVTHDARMVRFTDRTLAILDGVVTETSPAGSR